MRYDNDSPMYIIYNTANGTIVNSRNVTFTEQVENSTLSPIVDDVEGGMISEGIGNLYDGITNLESQDSGTGSFVARTESKGSGKVSKNRTVH